jgi:DNA modification methylase
MACEQMKRKCYGMELDEKYATVVLNRWEKFTGLKAKKL